MWVRSVYSTLPPLAVDLLGFMGQIGLLGFVWVRSVCSNLPPLVAGLLGFMGQISLWIVVACGLWPVMCWLWPVMGVVDDRC